MIRRFTRGVAVVGAFALVMAACAADGVDGMDGADGADGRDGVDGMDGADGTNGVDGMDGEDARFPDPVDTSFSFAVTNDGHDHAGMNVLTLDFDGTAPSGMVVVSSRVTTPPRIDGVDGGTDEWGTYESVVVFDGGESGNGITGATLRSVYNDQWIYFFAQWQETDDAVSGNVVGRTDTRRTYTYDATAGTWSRAGDEDRAFFIFPVVDATDPSEAFATGGCASACHAVEDVMRAPAGAIWDVWHWKAARTGPTGTLDDKWWDDNGGTGSGRHSDYGMSAYWQPGTADMPAFMPYDIDPTTPTNRYPAWVWEAEPFDATLPWADGSTLPGVFNRLPTGSRADVVTMAGWDEATSTWTLEIMRLRFTGNGDDVSF